MKIFGKLTENIWKVESKYLESRTKRFKASGHGDYIQNDWIIENLGINENHWFSDNDHTTNMKELNLTSFSLYETIVFVGAESYKKFIKWCDKVPWSKST